jgi:hypothetical protein
MCGEDVWGQCRYAKVDSVRGCAAIFGMKISKSVPCGISTGLQCAEMQKYAMGDMHGFTVCQYANVYIEEICASIQVGR